MEQLSSFRYQDVWLKKSHWEEQRAETIERYLDISDDDLMHYFRTLAGLPTEAKGLMGWYGRDADTFGQLISAYVKLFLVSDDNRLKEKAVSLCEEWGICADASERIIDCNGTYVYDKLMGGFADMLEYLQYQPAVNYMQRLTESAMKRFPRTISRDGLQDAGLCDTNMIEWYTLPEQLYRAYLLTGNEQYKEFASQWEYDYLWDHLLEQNQHTQIGPRHAYSQVNSLSSAAMAYRVKSDPRYLEVLTAAYPILTGRHMFATGGYGPAECMFADEGYLGDSLKDAWDSTKKQLLYRNFSDTLVTRNDNWGSCEVSCCSWAVFKYCNYLLLYTKKAAYGDWAERLLYNGTGGQLPITIEGKVMYYAGYFLDGALKTTEDRRLQPDGINFLWQCCTGTYPQDVAEYTNMLYYFDEEGLYVSQYLPSEVHQKKWGLTLENISQYPQEERLTFRIRTKTAQERSLYFRVPSWVSGDYTVEINGTPHTGEKAVAGEWLQLKCRWEDQDKITVHFPMRLRFEPVDEANSDIVALCYGPIVLAGNQMGILRGDLDHPEDWIERLPGEELAFQTKPGHVKGYDFDTRTFTPYYLIKEMQWYYLYYRMENHQK